MDGKNQVWYEAPTQTKTMKKHVIFLALLIILSFWSIKPLLGEGFFPMHDDTQVGRVVAMGRALRNGQFPVRWVSELGYGYGYPIFNFYGPLPYYVGGFLYALGIHGLQATKLMMILGIILSGITMYALSGYVFGRLAGVVAGVLYMYIPYHAVQVYVRGAVGELWSVAFLPLVVLGIFLISGSARGKAGVLIGGLGLAGVIVSHTVLGYVTVTALLAGGALYALLTGFRKHLSVRPLLSCGFMAVLGLGLSAFFWLPALAEMQFTAVAAQVSATADFHTHFVCVTQLWSSPWGFGGSAPGCLDGMSFKLGKLHILLAGFSVLLLFVQKRMSFSFRRTLWAVLIGTLVSVFFMTEYSVRLWEVVPYAAYVQYPWRLLAFSALGLSLLGGGLIRATDKKVLRGFLGVGVIVVTILTNAKWFVPQYTYEKPFRDFESSADIRFRVSSISDEYLPPGIPEPKSVTQTLHDTIQAPENVRVETEIDTETYIKSFIETDKDVSLRITRAYFPGWHFLVNGREVAPLVSEGLPTVRIPAGRYALEARFTDTPVRSVANMLTLITVGILIAFYGKKTIT